MAAELAEIRRAVTSEKGAMPPGRWQPAHFWATTGATSRVKLGAAAGVVSPRTIASAASGTASDATPAATTAMRTPLRMRVICTPKLAESATDLADRAPDPQRLSHRRQEVLLGVGRTADPVEGRGGTGGVSFGAQARCTLALAALDLRIDLLEVDGLRLVLCEGVDADDDAGTGLHLGLEAEGGRLDLRLHEALLDSCAAATELVDAGDQLRRALLE